jgi:hypothetical protein
MAIDPSWVKIDMGGPDGKITTAQNVTGIMNMVDNLELKHFGSFFVYDFTQLPW